MYKVRFRPVHVVASIRANTAHQIPAFLDHVFLSFLHPLSPSQANLGNCVEHGRVLFCAMCCVEGFISCFYLLLTTPLKKEIIIVSLISMLLLGA